MSNWDVFTFSRDLSDLIMLILKHEVPVDTESLYALDSKFQYSDKFFVSIDDILFKVDKKISGTIPEDIRRLEILFSHMCRINPDLDEMNNDPITEYNFQLHIRGYDKSVKEYVNCWHLDKNIESDKQKFTHPYYHFQAGGNEIESVNSGDVILLGAPRLPHPPMDLFLGFHFIVNNFFSSKDYCFINRLLADVLYQEIICRAQKRMWENYFKAFSDNSHNHFTRQNVFPLYVEM